MKVTVHINNKNEVDGLCNDQGSLGYLKNENGSFKLFDAEVEQIMAFNNKELKARIENNKLIFYIEETKEENENEKESTNTDSIQNNPTEEGRV
jgi:hypothetical protein